MHYEVLVVDDHPLFRAALKDAVRAFCTDCRFIEADSVASLFDSLDQHPHADLLLLDLSLPGAYGFCALAHLRGSHPELPVIVISASDDRHTVRQALAFGAQGFISKSADADRIGRSVQALLQGENLQASAPVETESALGDTALELAQRLAQLTAQQFRVFGMLCAGKLNKQIAHELDVTEATIKAHMTAIMRKLGVANRTQAALLAGHLRADPNELVLPPEEPED
jgi:DNA-binding NarL/FixJ family response regulator